jgi:hypothetical protein
MQSNVWKKSVLIIGSLFLVFSLANIVGASKASKSEKDNIITSMIVNKLESDSQLQGSSIDVQTIGGEVTLKGTVNSHADIARAAELARSIDGVKHVDNRLISVSDHRYGRTAYPSWSQNMTTGS